MSDEECLVGHNCSVTDAENLAAGLGLLEQVGSIADVMIEVEESMLQFYLAAIFLTLFCMLLGFFVYTLRRERARYETRHIRLCGNYSDYLRYRFAYWFTWTSGSTG